MTETGVEAQEEFDLQMLDVVSRFLETVVVVDDQAFSGELKSSPKVSVDRTTRSGRAVKGGLAPPIIEDRSEHDLDPKAIIDAFAKVGLICAILEPTVSSDESENFINTARRADLVVLDWVIHRDQGNKTLSLVKSILEADKSPSYRLRTIAIYTGEKDLRNVAKRLRAQIEKVYPNHKVEELDRGFTFRCGPVHATVFAKGTVADLPAEYADRRIEVADLPSRLQSEFARLTSGLISGVAIAALGALRNDTHRLLEAVGPNIDRAHLGQRIALSTPADAEVQAASLVIDEIESIIQDNEISKFANLETVKKWLTSAANTQDKYGPVDGSHKAFSLAEVESMLEYGLESDKGLDAVSSSDNSRSYLRKDVKPKATRLFYDNDGDADNARSELASKMWTRSLYGMSERVLHLGTIVWSQATEKYLLCMQPLCDSVRLTESRPFPFLPLTITKDSNVDIVIKDVITGQWVHLSSSRAPHRTMMLSFTPSERLLIEAKNVSKGKFVFKDDKRKIYIWIAELRQEFAQRFANELANQYARVGVDDPETFRHRH